MSRATDARPIAEIPAGERTWRHKLKEIRRHLGITQREAASRCGVALRTWIGWENNQVEPGNPAQHAIRTAFPQFTIVLDL